MADYQTTMKDLLANLKTLLSAETTSGNTLYGIRQIKRGILPPVTQLPLITLLPQEQRYDRIRSSGLATVDFQVQMVVVANVQRKDDIYNVHKYADAAVEKIRDNRTIPDSSGDPTVFNVEFQEIEVEDDREAASVVMNFQGEESLPARTVSATITNNPAPLTVITKVYDKINALKNVGANKLRSVHKEEWDESFTKMLPSVTIQMEGVNDPSWTAGRESPQMEFSVNVYSQVGTANDQMLLSHLDLVNVVKKEIQKHVNWDGLARDTQIDGITHAQTLANNDLLYSSNISMTAMLRHNK
tara:strand:+ start:413 stop:1312 length:900 start_codon:yes stop_codon:yes gene_type:complete